VQPFLHYSSATVGGVRVVKKKWKKKNNNNKKEEGVFFEFLDFQCLDRLRILLRTQTI